MSAHVPAIGKRGVHFSAPTPLPSVSPISAPDHPPAPVGVAAVPVVRKPRPSAPAPRATPAARALVTDVVRRHADELLRHARRCTSCPDDAHDAYQRTLELMLERAAEIDRRKAVAWAYTVISREAARINRERHETVPLDDDPGSAQSRAAQQPGPDSDVEAIDVARRAQEVLQTLPDAQAQALCLRAQGLSYDDIASVLGWSPRKVKRAISDGQRAFAARYSAVSAGLICDTAASDLPAYLDGTLNHRARLQLRAHLVRCPGCRAALHGHRSDHALQALLPPVAIVGVERRHWFGEHVLTPIDHLLARSTGALDQLTATKLGAAAAASSAALAGGGVAASTQLRAEPPPPPLQASLASPAPAAGAKETPAAAPATGRATVQDAVQVAIARERTLRERREAAARRRAERRRKAERQELAASREFAPATTEFAAPPAPSSSSAPSSRSTTDAAPVAAPPSTQAPQEVATAPADDSTVDVVVEGAP